MNLNSRLNFVILKNVINWFLDRNNHGNRVFVNEGNDKTVGIGVIFYCHLLTVRGKQD